MNKYVKWGSVGLALLLLRGSKMIYPLSPVTITSPFGNRVNPVTGVPDFHNGIDLAAATGTVIKSPADGTVYQKYYNSLGGNQLIIKHTNGYSTGYAHLSAYQVAVGDTIKKGQPIANVGSTGEATGPHLHFVLIDKDGVTAINPVGHFS